MTKLRDPKLYINRELSQLEFNFRVLAQARDPSLPLLERLRFLAIACSNLDEFFEIRVAGLKFSGQPGPDGLAASEVLKRIRERTSELVGAQYQLWNRNLRPALRKSSRYFLHWGSTQPTRFRASSTRRSISRWC
jgi:polyphosphate kinase